MREVEHEASQIRGEDLRLGVGIERRRLRLVPQAVADARRGASGASAPLVGGGARDAHGFETREADVRLVARHPREPGIKHDAHPLDGERGLRDRGRKHDLAPSFRGRRDGAVLRPRIQRTEERHDVDRRIGDALGQPLRRAADFGGARQKHEHRARIGAQRTGDRVGDLAFDRRAGIAAQVARLDRKRTALARDHRRIAEKSRDTRAVECCRHDEELEIVAQAALHVERQCQPEIGIERTLVEFVEQHGGDAGERRIVEDQPREHALGHDLDARAA